MSSVVDLMHPRPRLAEYSHLRYWPSWICIGLFKIFSYCPVWLARWIGRILGCFIRKIHRSRTIRTNIDICFSDKTSEERDQIENAYYQRATQAVLNVGVALFGSEEKVKSLVKMRGKEYVEKAKKENRPIIILAPHFLGLELGWARLSLEYPAIGMYRDTKYELLNQYVLHARTRTGGLGLERYASMKPLIKAMREGFPFYYLPDQDPDKTMQKGYEFTPFFGQPAATFTALGRIARMTNAVVIPAVTRQCNDSRGYILQLYPPLENFPIGEDGADTLRMNQEIESLVRQFPDQYLWGYRRFKTQPGNAPSPYHKCKKPIKKFLFAKSSVRD